MLKFLKTTAAFSLLFLCFNISVKASHIAGGEITYTCLGNNQYKINLNLFVDCAGFNPGASQTVSFSSTCGGTASLQVQVTPATQNGLEISQLCAAQLPNSTCNNGNLPGMWLFNYEGIVTLAPPCDTWKMSWSTCCRNSAITNLSSSSSNYYVEATLNSATDPCNSSPQFHAQPIPYVCVNQPVTYSYGVTEPDGDSLYYQLIPGLTAANTPGTYNAPYSGTSPIPGIVINSQTGLVTFTPSTLGNFVVVIKVTEYDRITKKVLGTVMRDIQFVVMSCTNIVPSPTAGTINNLTGNAIQTGPYAIEMCAGDSFNFTATYTDANATDVLTDTSNIATALPGAIITQVGTSTNPLTLNISWTAPPGSQGQNPTFTITVSDGACPLQGQQTFVYYVNILHATIAGPDQTICGSQTAQINATGGSIFNWTVISGAPMTTANFSCNPCANPVASPNVTTTYEVTSNLSGTCKNKDTITINVVPDFTFNITQSSTNSCLLNPIQLDVINILPATAGYTFQWSPSTNLSNASIQNPVATFTTPGTYSYVLTITNPFGCVKKDSLTITVIPAVTPVISAFSDTIFCAGGTATLGLKFTNSAAPANCGLSLTGGCGGTGAPITVGTGTSSNTTSGYPAPYGNFYKNARHQFLFRASELLAAGVVPGKIDRLDFNVTTINGTTTYTDYTILMGCTNLTSLSSWQTGLFQVYNPKVHNVTTGWNAHTFDNAFLWDGISNVIIEICFDNRTAASFTQNSASPYTTTPFTSCLYFRSDSQPACGNNSNFVTTSSNRPNIRLHNCTIIANPANYSYQWAPASGNIANATIQNTTGQPTATTTYTVTVTDIAGGCTATDIVSVVIINITSVTVTPVNPICVNASPITLVSSAPSGLGSWSGTGITNAANGIFDPAVAGAGTHQIIYTINAACGNAADTINIVVIPLPDATITNVAPICLTAPAINLTAATTGGVWSGTGITSASNGTFDPSVAGLGTHTLTYSLSTPCASSDTALITVINQLSAIITPAGPFCTGAAAITMVAANTGGTWSGTGITNTTTGVFDPAVAGAGSHLITYTIPGICGSIDTAIVNVIASPIISFSPDKTDGCEPTNIVFTSTTNQPGGTCLWDFGDGTTSTVCNPSHTYLHDGVYSVTFTYANNIGCSSTVTQTNLITIYSQPIAGYTATPQPTTIVQPLVQFTDASVGQVDTWYWNFGILGTSTVQNPYLVYPDTGSYPFQLIVSNIHGCSDTLNSHIKIDPIATFYAPNAFTPNGNGTNDEFKVYADGINRSTFEMLIYNRWGELIFKSNNIYNGWNGRKGNTGTMVESDVYVWKVRYLDFSGKENNHIGHVTLVK